MWSNLSMYWSFSEIRKRPFETSSIATRDSSEVSASSSGRDSANATSWTVAGAKQSRYLSTMRSVAALRSISGYSMRANVHFPRPSMSMRATLYIDSSFLSDLRTASSLASRASASSEMDAPSPTFSRTSSSIPVRVRSLQVAAA